MKAQLDLNQSHANEKEKLRKQKNDQECFYKNKIDELTTEKSDMEQQRTYWQKQYSKIQEDNKEPDISVKNRQTTGPNGSIKQEVHEVEIISDQNQRALKVILSQKETIKEQEKAIL